MRLPCDPSTTMASTFPERMAFMVASASTRRACKRFSSARNCCSLLLFGTGISLLGSGLQVQPYQHALVVRQIANNPPQRQGQLFDQGGGGHNLFILGQGRLLVKIDDFQIVLSLQVLRADCIDIEDGAPGRGCRPRHVQAKHIPFYVPGRSLRHCPGFRQRVRFHDDTFSGHSSSRTSTCCVFDRSPMIRFNNGGSRRTRVGTAMIWSPAAICGCFNRSTTSTLYRPRRCSLQSLFRLRMAVIDREVLPVTYRRSFQTSPDAFRFPRPLCLFFFIM